MTKFSWKCRRHEQIWVGGVGESTNFQIKLLCWLIDSLQNRIWCPRSMHFISLNVQTRALFSEKIWGINIRHFPIKRHFDLIFPNFNKKQTRENTWKLKNLFVPIFSGEQTICLQKFIMQNQQEIIIIWENFVSSGITYSQQKLIAQSNTSENVCWFYRVSLWNFHIVDFN